MASEEEIISVISQLISIDNPWEVNNGDANTEIMALIIRLIYMVDSMNLDRQQKQPKSELMLLITQTISIFNSMVMDDSQPELLRKLISFITQKTSLDIDPFSEPELDLLQHFGKVLSLEPEPELISLIRKIVSLVMSMDLKWKKLISLCPQVAVRLDKGKLLVEEAFMWETNYKLCCFPLFWLKFKSTGEDDATHFFCRGCNGKNHYENDKAPVEIKHPLHPKHSLQLALLQKSHDMRQCYCCDESLQELFYYCSACDYAMNIACVEKQPVFSIDHPKWHKHTLALFPRQTPFTCSVCALDHTTCPFYICPPCDFVIHQKCISLPRVIRISRHPHRISFTHSFRQGDWSCCVCRQKIDNDYGGYSCIKDGCSYAAHSKCATQKNVWDGKELEDTPEENEEEVEPPFVRISDGNIAHFSHRHHLRLEENTGRDYDVNKLCQGCVMPIYIGNFYSCMQCDYILHETCANLSRKIHHPIHPHMLTLRRGSQGLLEHNVDPCSACPWMCKAGFFYECQEGGDEYSFRLHVQCATIAEPLLHKSHIHSLFLTSKPGEKRRCSVCKKARQSLTNETFNCIECDYFALCFGCATLPQEVRYEHDKHMLTLSYGEKTNTMTYWCEVCEQKINPKERFYTCDEYCCVTLHIECLLGQDLYIKPGSYWLNFYFDRWIYVRHNNHHMTRRFCFSCKKRCPHKIVLESSNSMFCSTSCVRDFLSKEVDTSGIREFLQRRGYEDDEF
ncbi:Protein VACUOLELESS GAMETOPHYTES [Cardamine amara subsp. amara]|uniref:Protein VACUOLELESS GAMETOPHYTES n=1 Tax=Cardamine amara subsp. amara TaxID=228776 RepID=A0ABD1CA07_CARAN